MDDISQTIFAISYGYITFANATSVLSKIQKGNYDITPEIVYNLSWLLGLYIIGEIDPLGNRPINLRTAGALSAGSLEIGSSLKRLYKNLTQNYQIDKINENLTNPNSLEKKLQTKTQI